MCYIESDIEKCFEIDGVPIMDVMCDIIIPIYNAYEDLVLCVESVYKYTDLKTNRLVLINDNSTDPRIKEYLDSQKKENVIVIHNEVNNGFSKNINTGMSLSETNDVLLLNSDTIVTFNWLEKIKNCAYREKQIGTVTPLSNNATLCSVPNFCEENTLPEDMSLEKTAETVERVSLKKYPEISVAHGFCMYIKREVINAIGMFDAATFQRGYGEENDFCNRAIQVGYRHVMCDDTYILHTGTKSFLSKEKEEYIREHDRILRERYPQLMHANDVHVRDNPNRCVSDNLKPYFAMGENRKNILYVLQSDFKQGADDNVGGTQLHVKHLTQKMKDKYNVFVAARDRDYLNLTFYHRDKEFSWRFFIGRKPDYYTFNDARIRNAFENIILGFNIEMVHIHHLCTLSFDVVEIADELGVPVLFTLHDYFMICPSEKLLDERHIYISKENDTENVWTKYLEKEKNIYNKIDYIKIWRVKCHHILRACDKLILPNESVKEIFTSYYSDLANKMEVIEHGYEFDRKKFDNVELSDKVVWKLEDKMAYGETYKFVGWAVYQSETKYKKNEIYLEITSNNSKAIIPTSKVSREDVKDKYGREDTGFEVLVPFRYLSEDFEVRAICVTDIGCFGAVDTLHIEKKSKNSYRKRLNVAFIGGINEEKGGKVIYEIIKGSGLDVNWFLFGKVGYDKLSGLIQKNYYWFGGYSNDDLPRLMEEFDVDLVCILSIWPETYSYTLSEAILCEKPVLVSDMGALGQRMGQFCQECCLPLDNLDKRIKEAIQNLMDNPTKLDRIKEEQSQLKVRTLDDMRLDYDELYMQMALADLNSTKTADYEYLYINSELGNGNTSEMKTDVDLRRYAEITNSATYRFVQRLSRSNFIGLRIAKKIIKKLMKIKY
ncbi:Glycosyltransferase, GT2 family [Butyrivibrio proteoclasticus]|uniref:Glycosyltransferase, GT2 family n=1 Tax=Butyrivibrio proteoclasticus TaxID=43305 RepID=A0A1I5PV39_9FIRM|nr:glycosyltransferase [Butyrivibrio proteoclasticus]SFP37933.1 Glycosyltransferase, GT2 family [Butyrivibrio proteoclasticus]